MENGALPLDKYIAKNYSVNVYGKHPKEQTTSSMSSS